LRSGGTLYPLGRDVVLAEINGLQTRLREIDIRLGEIDCEIGRSRNEIQAAASLVEEWTDDLVEARSEYRRSERLSRGNWKPDSSTVDGLETNLWRMQVADNELYERIGELYQQKRQLLAERGNLRQRKEDLERKLQSR
jgi:chromosome segregation ATPase